MIVNRSIINAINCIKPILDMSNQAALGNVLFHFGEAGTTLSLRYNDNKNSIAVNIPVVIEDGDFTQDIVVNYKQLSDVLSLCVSGQLKVDDFKMTVNPDKHTMRVSCVKKFAYTVGDEVVEKPTSKFEQDINYYEPESSMKYALLTRMDYGQMFNSEGESWSIDTLKTILSKLAIEKTKPVSISSQKNIAFVNTFSFASVMPLNNVQTSLIIPYAAAKALITILSKVDKDSIIIGRTEDDKFVNITDGETIGIQFPMGSVSKIDVSTISAYAENTYSDYKLKFIREAFINIVDAIIATDKSDSHTLKFAENEEGELVMTLGSTNTEKSNTYSIVVSGKVDNREEVLNLEIPISIKIIKDMLSLCEQPYVTFYMSKGDRNRLRIGDLDLSRTTGADDLVHTIENYTLLGNTAE